MGYDAEATRRRIFQAATAEFEDEAAALARRRASVMEAARVLAESHRFG